MRRVYLAGPPFADEYRTRAAALLAAAGFEAVSPRFGSEAWNRLYRQLYATCLIAL